MATAAPRRTFLGRIGLRKSVAQIQEETATSELKRSLGPVEPGLPRHRLHHRRRHLRPHRQCRGAPCRPGRAASPIVIAGVICAFAGLCYAELSSTLPVSGSAYTYSYATIGEFAAWVMGALLLLEYGLAASVVAVGWSGYMVSLLGDIGIHIPATLTGPAGPSPAEGRRRRARQRRAGRLSVQPARLPGLRRPGRAAGASACRNRPSSTTSSSPSR